MSRSRLVWVILLLCFLIAGCSNEKISDEYPAEYTDRQNQNDEVNQTDLTSMPNESASGSNVIVWAFMDDLFQGEDVEERVNRQLESDGYPFRLKCEFLCKGTRYSEYRQKMLECDADIVYTGLLDSGDKTILSPAFEGIKQDCFLKLDEYLKDSRLYESLPEELWDSVKTDDGIYCIPNTMICDSGLAIVFKKDDFTQKEIDEYDDTMEGLFSLLSEEKKLFVLNGSFLDLYGIKAYENYGIYYEDGRINNLMDMELNLDWLRKLNQLYKSGMVLKCDRDILECEEEWSVAMVYNRDVEMFDSGRYYIKKYKGDIDEHFTGSIAIKKDSKNPDYAFRMLNLFLTDPEYANLIIYGNEVEDIEGNAFDPVTKQPIYSFNRKLSWGINDAAYRGAGDYDYTFSSPEERKNYYDMYCRPAELSFLNYPEQMYELYSLSLKHKNIIYNTKSFEDELEKWVAKSDKIFESIIQ